MKWPAFLNKNLETGNLESSVALCTLWTQADEINVPNEMFAVKGNLYSGSGIKYLLRNLLANPKIRYLIVCGNDRACSGDDLVNLFESGTDEKGNIINSRTRLDSRLTPELIGMVRKNVELIDMRGKDEEIAAKIRELEEKPPYSSPLFVEEAEEKVSEMDVRDISGFRIESESIGGMWLRLIDLVMKFGETKKSEHGMMQKELLNTMAVIERDDGRIPGFLPFEKKDLDKYHETFFGRGHGKGMSYTYGERLFNYTLPGSEVKLEKESKTTFDQIGNALGHLKKSPHTRRAAAFTWNVHEDSVSKNPPCLTQITWNIKYGKLYETAVFRSHDIFGGWPLNAFALRELQNSMASDLGIEPASLTIISNSAHIYENNFGQAADIIREHHSGRSSGFSEDNLGYFTVKLENREIVASHHLPDGQETEFVFRGPDAAGVYRKILHESLVSRMDHAAYLGSELSRAEHALKSGEIYVQK